MIARLSSLVVWGLAAAAAVAWGLKMGVGRTAVPEHAAVATAAPPAGGDLTRVLGVPQVRVAAETPPPPAAARFNLVGVVAPAPGRSEGWAVIAVDGKPARTVRLGREVEPGLVLQTVGHRRVELVGRGQAPVVLELAALPAAQRGTPDRGLPAVPPAGGLQKPAMPAGAGAAQAPGQPPQPQPLTAVPAPAPAMVGGLPSGSGMVPNQEAPAQLPGQAQPDVAVPAAAPGMGGPPSR